MDTDIKAQCSTMAADLEAARSMLTKTEQKLTWEETVLWTLIAGTPTYGVLTRRHTDLEQAYQAYDEAYDRFMELLEDDMEAALAVADYNTVDGRINTLRDDILEVLDDTEDLADVEADMLLVNLEMAELRTQVEELEDSIESEQKVKNLLLIDLDRANQRALTAEKQVAILEDKLAQIEEAAPDVEADPAAVLEQTVPVESKMEENAASIEDANPETNASKLEGEKEVYTESVPDTNAKPVTAAEVVPAKVFNLYKAFREEPEGHDTADTVEKPEAVSKPAAAEVEEVIDAADSAEVEAKTVTDVKKDEASKLEIPATVSPMSTKMEGTEVVLEESELSETVEAKTESSEVQESVTVPEMVEAVAVLEVAGSKKAVSEMVNKESVPAKDVEAETVPETAEARSVPELVYKAAVAETAESVLKMVEAAAVPKAVDKEAESELKVAEPEVIEEAVPEVVEAADPMAAVPKLVEQAAVPKAVDKEAEAEVVEAADPAEDLAEQTGTKAAVPKEVEPDEVIAPVEEKKALNQQKFATTKVELEAGKHKVIPLEEEVAVQFVF